MRVPVSADRPGQPTELPRPYGLVLTRKLRKWLLAALDLRIAQRGNDGDDAVAEVIELLRVEATMLAENIIISRRRETVMQELNVDYIERRRRKRVGAILRGERLNQIALDKVDNLCPNSERTIQKKERKT